MAVEKRMNLHRSVGGDSEPADEGETTMLDQYLVNLHGKRTRWLRSVDKKSDENDSKRNRQQATAATKSSPEAYRKVGPPPSPLEIHLRLEENPRLRANIKYCNESANCAILLQLSGRFRDMQPLTPL